jgi:hypothetical protein
MVTQQQQQRCQKKRFKLRNSSFLWLFLKGSIYKFEFWLMYCLFGVYLLLNQQAKTPQIFAGRLSGRKPKKKIEKKQD